MTDNELPTTTPSSGTEQLHRRALILRSAFLQYQNAKGFLEQEIANVREIDTDYRRLNVDSVERLLGLFRELDYVEPNILKAVHKLIYPNG